MAFSIIDGSLDNIMKYGVGCSNNKKYPGFTTKHAWMKKQYQEGLVIKYLVKDDKPEGFIEAAPGEVTWRGIDAPGYLIIQCIYIYAKKHKNIGLGTRLIEAIIEEARTRKMKGVAVLASDGSFLASKEVFGKLKFKIIMDPNFPTYEIAYHPLVKPAKKPQFTPTNPPLSSYKGLHIIYSDQCPYVSKGIADLEATAADLGFSPQITKIDTPGEARALPSPYGTFMVIYDGVIEADHYISKTRLKNILTRECK